MSSQPCHPAIETTADILLALERTPALAFGLTVLRETGDDQATVCVRADRGTWYISPAEAVDVAAALRAEQAFQGADTLARAFEDRALEARQLDALLDASFDAAPALAGSPDAPLAGFLIPHGRPVRTVTALAFAALTLAIGISVWPLGAGA